MKPLLNSFFFVKMKKINKERKRRKKKCLFPSPDPPILIY